MAFCSTAHKSQLEMILNNLNMAIALVDQKGELVYWNDIYLQMLKCTAEEFQTRYKNTYQTLSTGDLDHSFSMEVLESGTRAEGCQKLRDIHGEVQYLYATHLPVFGSDGKVAYSLGIIEYVSKIKERYFRAIDKLESVAGHDLFPPSEPGAPFIYHDPETVKLVRVARGIAETDATVLLLGETGTGKDVFAHFIHENSRRSAQKMVCVNCAAIPADLFEAELFGYEAGAFTGAMRAGKRGLLEDAEGGTLFLDEIDSMPLAQQSKLLRVIEQKSFQRVGSVHQKPADFRLIAASNADLLSCVDHNTFRLDLYFRLNVASLEIPPLRKRKGDIIPLAQRFIETCSERYQRRKIFSHEALDQLLDHSWPGNVRELKNMIERIFLLTDPAQVELDRIADQFFCSEAGKVHPSPVKDMALSIAPGLQEGMTLDEMLAHYERQILKEALDKYGSPKLVEERLGLSHATLFRKINKYRLKRCYQ